jgi:hypothetical protein
MDKLKDLLSEAPISPEEIAETLLNGNISDFKRWAKKASRSNVLKALEAYTQMSGENYTQSIEYFKKLLQSGAMEQAIKEAIHEYNKGAVLGGKKPTINDPIDEPATGFVYRKKENTGKQHHITPYDNQWENKEIKKSKRLKLKNFLRKKKAKKG